MLDATTTTHAPYAASILQGQPPASTFHVLPLTGRSSHGASEPNLTAGGACQLVCRGGGAKSGGRLRWSPRHTARDAPSAGREAVPSLHWSCGAGSVLGPCTGPSAPGFGSSFSFGNGFESADRILNILSCDRVLPERLASPTRTLPNPTPRPPAAARYPDHLQLTSGLDREPSSRPNTKEAPTAAHQVVRRRSDQNGPERCPLRLFVRVVVLRLRRPLRSVLAFVGSSSMPAPAAV